jgi:phospholipid/cholesterol/gamma-HCH transport system ATP-binding protein
MGGSGCGKTTILRLIGGQLRPSEGRVVVAGRSVPDLDRDGLYALRREIGMLFQFGALFTDMTVFDNIAFPLREHTDLSDQMIRDLVLMKLNAVGLRGAAGLVPSALSGGMARRVALARAIALDPMLASTTAVRRPRPDLARHRRPSASASSTTRWHHVGHRHARRLRVPSRSSTTCISCPPGRIIAQGTPDEVRASTDPFVRQFVDGGPTARCRSTSARRRSPRSSPSMPASAIADGCAASGRARAALSRGSDSLPASRSRCSGTRSRA